MAKPDPILDLGWISLNQEVSTPFQAASGATERSTVRRSFNITQAITLREELVYHFAKFLTVNDLISLYEISKEFHYMVNEIFTSVVLEQGTQEAPDSAIVFPLRCYRRLCILDLVGGCYEDDKHIRTLSWCHPFAGCGLLA